MKLDILQNPNITLKDNAFFFSLPTQNIPPASQTIFKHNQKELEALSEYFGGESGGNFSFLSGAFSELLLSLHTHKHNIALALSNHQQAYQSYHLLKSIIPITPILPTQESGIIENLNRFNSCDTFIIPYINQDLLTINPIQKLIKQREDALFIIDISYAVRFGLKPKIEKNTIFLCDCESLGFLRGHGVFLSSLSHTHYFSPTRYTHQLYGTLLQKIKSYCTPKEDKKEEFFSLLNHKDISLFAPLTHSLCNTLALRLKGVKARNLLQSLQIEGINVINGQECLFGFSRPSFLLQEMGYTELISRELLSISFTDFDPKIPSILAHHYNQLRTLEI